MGIVWIAKSSYNCYWGKGSLRWYYLLFLKRGENLRSNRGHSVAAVWGCSACGCGTVFSYSLSPCSNSTISIKIISFFSSNINTCVTSVIFYNREKSMGLCCITVKAMKLKINWSLVMQWHKIVYVHISVHNGCALLDVHCLCCSRYLQNRSI